MFTLYILYSSRLDKYYLGYTNDMSRRISEHNRIKGKFTDAGIPWEVVYTETFSTREEAAERESFIKGRKSRKYIKELISGR